ncbi:MAG TPA: hypothetical protein VK540_19420 [Polyangiaceae bacterium]|nr:hypothetical protein [Polyangiaceae bacterium]
MAANKADAGATPSFDASALETDAASAVAAVVHAAERGPALVEAWVQAKNAGAVAAVAEDDKAPAPARKAARRGLNVLKARGVAVPERARVTRLAGDPVEGYDAWFVPPDGAGTHMVILAARRQSGKHYVVHTTMREEAGLLDVRALEMSRSQLRASFEESARRMGYHPVAVPIDWARARVAAARANNAKSGAILPLGLDSHAEVLGPAPDQAPPHPIDQAKLEIPAASAVVAHSADLHREPELGAWLPDGPAVQELLIEVGQKLATSGGPEQDAKKVDDAVREALDNATDRFFGPDVREHLAARMKDAAISILARQGRERAAEVMAIASAVVAAGLITLPPHEIPFLRGFFQKALAIIASQSGGQLSIPVPVVQEEAATPSGLAQPGDKVSPGGIILP